MIKKTPFANKSFFFLDFKCTPVRTCVYGRYALHVHTWTQTQEIRQKIGCQNKIKFYLNNHRSWIKSRSSRFQYIWILCSVIRHISWCVNKSTVGPNTPVQIVNYFTNANSVIGKTLLKQIGFYGLWRNRQISTLSKTCHIRIHRIQFIVFSLWSDEENPFQFLVAYKYTI